MKAKKRLLSLLLCGTMLFSLCPQSVLAETSAQDSGAVISAGGLCKHHSEHDEDCGYTEGTAGFPCTYEHTDDCYREVINCTHKHDQDCYLQDSVSEDDATPSNAEKREPENCPHICDEDSGCVTKELDCQHEHDDACGYAPATKGTPCKYVCQICNPQDGGSASGQNVQKPEEEVKQDGDEDECICTEPCWEDNVNVDCPVCGIIEEEDLALCKGAKPETATPSNAAQLSAGDVQKLIDGLPTADELAAMSLVEQQEVYEKLQAAYEAYNALTEEQKEEVIGAEIFDSLFSVFASMTNTLTEEQFPSLVPGETYWFDLSGQDIPGTVNNSVPDLLLTWVPFTYVGTINAYSRDSEGVSTEDNVPPYAHSLFIADYNLTYYVSWDELNAADIIFGKAYISSGVEYTLRAPSVGSNYGGSEENEHGTPESNEWDMILNKDSKDSDYIKNWSGMQSWGQDTNSDAGNRRSVRGRYFANYYNYYYSYNHHNDVGFRPVLEIPDTLNFDELQVVTVELGDGSIGATTGTVNLVVESGKDFTAPSGDGLTAPVGMGFSNWKGSDGKTYAPDDPVPDDVTTLTAQWVDPTAPTLSNGSVIRESETTATVKFTSDEAGEYYYVVVESDETQPDIDTTIKGVSFTTTQQTISLTNLSGMNEKYIYIVVKDAAGNVSEKLKITIPACYNISAIAGEGGSVSGGGIIVSENSATVTAIPNEDHHFVRWTENGQEVSTKEIYQFTVTGDRTLTAVFEEHSGGTAPCGERAKCAVCGEEYGDPGKHNLTQISEKPAACTETGTIEHWHCSVCNKNFFDADGQKEVSDLDLSITALGHDWDTPDWKWNEDYTLATANFTCKRDSSHTEAETDSSPTSEITKEAACTAAGEKKYTAKATLDGQEYYGTATAEIPATGHRFGSWKSNYNGTHTGTCTHGCGEERTEGCNNISGRCSKCNYEWIAISAQPQSQTVKEGETATFRVAATGSSITSYQWQVSTDNGVNWTDIDSATNMSYTTTEAEMKMNGSQYRVVVSNSGDQAESTAATLNVQKIPTIIEPTFARYIVEHYKADKDSSTGYILSERGYLTGEIGETVTAIPKDYDGYTYNAGKSIASGTLKAISGTEDIVTLKLYYDVSSTPVVPGNTVHYIVEHYVDNGNGYTLKETEYPAGKIGETVTADSKHYVGYIYNIEKSTTSGELKEIKSESDILTLKLYYDLTVFTVTVESDSNGFASATQASAAMGTEIKLTVAPNTGYHFERWEIVSGDIAIADNAFIMPAADVIVKAIFACNSSGGGGSGGSSYDYFTITASAGTGGSISPSGSVSVREQLDKTFTITPNSGYCISDVLVDGKSVGAVSTYTFENVQKWYTIEAVFAKENPGTDVDNPFTDVHPEDWFFDNVMFVYGNGLMSGTSATTFDPYAIATRTQVAVIFYYMDGSPEVTGDSLFADVAYGPGTKWYYDAVLWAHQKGIVAGYEDHTYHPDDPVTREQLAVMFRNYANYKGYDLTATSDLSSFTDPGQVLDWALKAVKGAIGSGLMNDEENCILDPQGTATRAEVAAILHNFIERNHLVPPALVPGEDGGGDGTGAESGWTQHIPSL